jgi:uncharacterized protein YqjF (DUF2071 family)
MTDPSSTPWFLAMTWRRLLFMHWPIEPGVLAPLIPQGLSLDTFDGQAWIAVVPFTMTGVKPRGVPDIPYFSAFHELNVRTYVTDGRTSGVWFFSLDAAHACAVVGARLAYGLPYHHARMRLQQNEEASHYRCRRLWTRKAVGFAASYRPVGPVYSAVPRDLDYWLTERHCLFAKHLGRILRVDIRHEPWPLQTAEVEIEQNTMTLPIGVQLPHCPPLVHYAEKLEVVSWLPKQSRADRPT